MSSFEFLFRIQKHIEILFIEDKEFFQSFYSRKQRRLFFNTNDSIEKSKFSKFTHSSVTFTIDKSLHFIEVLSNKENLNFLFLSLKVSKKRQLFFDNESDDLEKFINHK